MVRSINDLTEPHGFGPMASAQRPTFSAFSLRDDPDGLWVAEEAGQMLGFAFSWICSDFWFLAQLFVSPGQQGRGIGDRLLKRTLDHARKRGATNRALITFAFNRVSQGLYIRHGLFPRIPLYLFSASREALASPLEGEQLPCQPLKPAHLPSLVHIDALTLGLSRERHHRFLLGESDMRGFAFYTGEDCVGYAYISSSGHIGPWPSRVPKLQARRSGLRLNVLLRGAHRRCPPFFPAPARQRSALP